MYAKVYGASFIGIEGQVIHVEVDISNGLPAFDIVGLPAASVRESKERVRAAIKNSGWEFPIKKITVNLAPADIKKDTPGLDLAIALGILAADGKVEGEKLKKALFIGELSLNGEVGCVSGVLPMALGARAFGLSILYIGRENAEEASLSSLESIYGIGTLKEVIEALNGLHSIEPWVKQSTNHTISYEGEDLSEVQGQVVAKRGLEIAAAGGHNILFSGAPGAGKTMLAKRIPSILPPLHDEEALEVTKIYSVAGLLKEDTLIRKRPFRNPHHTITMAGMVGGGYHLTPGEVTLAHGGVLFLDEAPEFKRPVLEVLRQPLEDKCIHLSKATGKVAYPSDFLLILSMNPCPCGNYGTAEPCICTPQAVQKYTEKLSGPLLDRIDLFIAVEKPKYEELVKVKKEESSAEVRKRVLEARKVQYYRLKDYGLLCNGQMSHGVLQKVVIISPEGRSLLEQVFKKLHLSARGYDRLIKVAQTIADLEGAPRVEVNHLAEAVGFRISLPGRDKLSF